MKEEIRKIISMTLGVIASIISFYYSRLAVTTLFQAFFAVIFAAMGIHLLDVAKTIIVGISFFVLGIFIFYNSVTLTKFNYSKKSKHLIIIGLFFLTYALYEFTSIYFKLGWNSAFPTLGVLTIGILSIIAGCLGISADGLKDRDLYLDDRKKFSKKIKVLSFLILLFIIINIIFNIYKINQTGYQEDVKNLELDGKVVFQKTSSRNGIYEQCMVDLSNPKEINCFEENGRVPYWGPDGKNVFYYKWDGEGYIDTVIYNMIDGTKKTLDGEDVYEENKELRESERVENPLNHHLKAAVSPDNERIVYAFAGTVYLLDHSGGQTVLLKSGYPSSKDFCRAATWYSNEQILLLCNLKSDDIFTKERYQRGFYLMDVDGSNLSLIVSNDSPYWLYYEYPDLYR